MVPYATVDRLEEIGGLIGDYVKGREDGGHGGASGSDALVALHTYVGETDDEARADAADPFDL